MDNKSFLKYIILFVVGGIMVGIIALNLKAIILYSFPVVLILFFLFYKGHNVVPKNSKPIQTKRTKRIYS